MNGFRMMVPFRGGESTFNNCNKINIMKRTMVYFRILKEGDKKESCHYVINLDQPFL